MNVVSKRVSHIAPSLTLEITAKAKKLKSEGASIIGFGAGEPDFNTPDYIIEAAKKALDIGFTKYTPASGMPELKKAVCKKLENDNGLDYSPEQIVVSSGAKSSLFHAISAIVDEGDEVVLPSPYWLTYPELIKLAGGKTVFVKSERENGYKMTSEQFAKAITPKTKCLILNSPNNPTGAVYTEEELRSIAKIAEANEIFVISDEIYEKLIYGDVRHFSIASVSAKMKELTIVVNGMSKSYSMTGWRIGYIAASKEIASAVSSMQSHTTSNACSIAQYASVAALEDLRGKDFISSMQKEFDSRRKFMLDKLKTIPNVACAEPNGAFYVFVDVSACFGKYCGDVQIEGSMSFANAALTKGVAVVPGVAFGDDNCIRLSYAVSMNDISEGLDRLDGFIRGLNDYGGKE